MRSKVWIEEILLYHSKTEQKATLLPMNKSYEIWFGGSPTERRFESIKCLLSDVKEI